MKTRKSTTFILFAATCCFSQFAAASGFQSVKGSIYDSNSFIARGIISGFSEDTEIASQQLSDALLNGKITLQQYNEAMVEIEAQQDQGLKEQK